MDPLRLVYKSAVRWFVMKQPQNTVSGEITLCNTYRIFFTTVTLLKNYGTFNRKHRVSYFDLSYVLLGHNDKGQAILKANYAIFLQNEHRLSFCINLEVVILEVEIQRLFFWEKLWLDNFVSRLTDL